MKIIYENELHQEEFDKNRYLNSLRRYGEIDENQVEQVIKEKIEAFPLRHVSVLVREAVPLFKREEDARVYYEDHTQDGVEGFRRLVRVCGYLTPDYRKANDGKMNEFADRTVSYTGKSEDKLAYSAISEEYYSAKAKGLRELEKQKHIQDNQNEYQKLDILD